MTNAAHQKTCRTESEQSSVPQISMTRASEGNITPALLQGIIGNQGMSLLHDERRQLEHADQNLGSVHPLFYVPIRDDEQAQQVLLENNALAAADEKQILARPGAFAGRTGHKLLLHEIAHVLQQNMPNLPSVGRTQAEAAADSYANATMSGSTASIGFSTPQGIAFKGRKINPGDRATSIAIIGNKAFITFHGPIDTYTHAYTVQHNIPPRLAPYTLSKGIILELHTEKQGMISFRQGKGDTPLTWDFFPDTIPLRVSKAGTPFKREVDEFPEAMQKEEKPGGGKKAPAKKEEAKTAPPPPAGLPAEKKKDPTESPVPVVKVSSQDQIEELKKKGLIPANEADAIKGKLDKQQALTFDEAKQLVEALNRFVAAETRQSPESKESWVKWAEFIQQNKDKLSGKVRGSDKGISVNEVKEVLKKHKEFVGVSDSPVRTARQAAYDPERRKSWNSLADWEKKLWTDYLAQYGKDADVSDPGTRDLRLTPSVRFSMARHMSTKYMGPGAREAAEQLFNDPLFIGSIAAGLTAYLALWVAPEPVFSKAAAVLATVGLVATIGFSIVEIKNLACAWMALDGDAARATNYEQLDKAAERFGKSVGGSGIRILLILAMHFGGKALPKIKPPATGGTAPAVVTVSPGTGGAGAATMAAGAEDAAVVIQVLKDGTIVILKGATVGGQTRNAMAAMQGGSGGEFEGGAEGTRPKNLKETKEPKDTSEAIKDLEQKGGTYKPGEPAAIGSEIEAIEVQNWGSELQKSGFRTYTRNQFGQARLGDTRLSRIFTDARSRPDMIGINDSMKQVIVGDVTAKPSTPAKVPGRIGQSEGLHVEKTIEYAKQLLRHWPADLKGWKVFAQDRFWQSGDKTKLIEVKPEGE